LGGADYCGRSPIALAGRGWRIKNRLSAIRIGRAVRFDVQMLDRWIERQWTYLENPVRDRDTLGKDPGFLLDMRARAAVCRVLFGWRGVAWSEPPATAGFRPPAGVPQQHQSYPKHVGQWRAAGTAAALCVRYQVRPQGLHVPDLKPPCGTEECRSRRSASQEARILFEGWRTSTYPVRPRSALANRSSASKTRAGPAASPGSWAALASESWCRPRVLLFGPKEG
jgi:hypothetical protein